MEIYELITYITNILKKLCIEYFITGSIASIFYGEPRFTNDIDIVADIKEKDIKNFIKCFPEDEFYLSEDAIRDAIIHNYQFNIIHPFSGIKIDIMIKKNNEFDNNRFQRRKKLITQKNNSADFTSPEDIIIMKMRYYNEGFSEKHIRDITGILKISGNELDKNYIEKWVDKFAIRDIWEKILSKK